MLVALHGNVFVGVPLGRPVDDLPLTVLCRTTSQEEANPELRQDLDVSTSALDLLTSQTVLADPRCN